MPLLHAGQGKACRGGDEEGPAGEALHRPAFTIVQVALFGPYTAKCEHNHRSTIEIWGMVFKCTATGAVALHVMAAYSTDAFVMGYLRFATRYGHPLKLLPDKGLQLVKACREMEYSWIDVKKTLSQEFCVGFEFDAAPVGGHNQHGAIEHSIQEIRKLFDTVFLSPKYKLDVLSYESCFAFIANDLNNLPLCLGTNFKDLSELDLLTPNRLLWVGTIVVLCPALVQKQKPNVGSS